MKKLILSFTLLFLANMVYCQEKAFVIYNAKGKKVSYKKMMKSLVKSDVLLFGELHNNPISHWLQYEVTTTLNKSREVILGAEMFEADNQLALNDYLSNKLTYKSLDSVARLWVNTRTDYMPLVDIAKKNKLPFIATNIPRRYANMVYKKGFSALDSLTANEKEWIAPLPILFDSELATYKNILAMMGEHGTIDLVKAQAMKDATMAHFILTNFKQNHLFIHYNGAYHSDFYEGILWYLKKQQANLNYATITTVSQEDVNQLVKENHNKADFIICVDDNMTTSY